MRLGALAPASPDSGLAVRVADGVTAQHIREVLERQPAPPRAPSPEDVADAHPFAEVLPAPAAVAMLDARERDPEVVAATLQRPLRRVRLGQRGPRP